MAAVDLPTHPSKGNRRSLDSSWLALLHRDGLSSYLTKVPEPPAGLRLGIKEFNQGEYWRCHETLERLWLVEGYPLRLYYHGLIKAAVGMLHLERRNRKGAMIKLQDAEYGLAPFLPRFMGVDTDRLRRDVIDRLTYLQAISPRERYQPDTVQDHPGESPDILGKSSVDWEAITQLPPVQILERPP